MIQFENWTISAPCGEVIARQYDNLSRTLTVMGDLPAGWDWSMLVESGGNLNIISLSPVDGGVGVTLTADMIPYAGYYRMQLRGTQGEAVRHTNILTQVYIPPSLTGEGQWPDLPSEFEQIEERMQELAGQAQDSADAADTSAKAAAESAAAAQGAEESVAANAKAAQDAANAAQTSEGNAKTSETNAAKSAGDAQTSAGQAADSATQAKTAQGKAEAAQTAAETAQGKAETAAGTATQAAQGAVTSAGQASQSAQEAASAATAAQNAQEAAEKAQGQAEAQATAAAGSATAAQESAAAAAGSSSSASGSAQTAQTAAQNAQKSAETAQEARQGAQAAQQAIEDLEVSSETLEPDSPASVEKTVSPEGVVTLEFGIPRGPQGQPGASAPQINDAIITDANPWSAKKIVDTLAPEFETSGAVVTCTPVAGYPLHVVSQIVAVQSGSGDPSPENVRPISGWAQATLTHNDIPITLSFGQTVYGGTLDWTTGVLTVDKRYLTLKSDSNIVIYPLNGTNGIIFGNVFDEIESRIPGVCSHALVSTTAVLPDSRPDAYIWLGVNSYSVYWVRILDVLGISTVDEFKQWLDTQNVQIVCPLNSPITIQLTPTEVLALSGTTTIYTDTGDTTVSGRADPNTILQQLAQRIATLEGQAING